MKRVIAILALGLTTACGYEIIKHPHQDFAAEMREDNTITWVYDPHHQVLYVNLQNCLPTKTNDHITALICEPDRPEPEVVTSEEEVPKE